MYTAASGPLQLDFWTCFFLDEKLLNNTIESGNGSSSESNVFCKAYGRYLAGSDPQSIVIGHIICVAFCTIIFITCIFGVVANSLNIIVLRRSITQDGSLKDLLIILAVVELLGCLSAMIYSYVIVNILENLDRSEFVFHCFRISNIIFSICRSASVYVTILITIERCLVVAFPVQSKVWLEPKKSLCYLLLALTISVVLNLPWILTSTVTKNIKFLAPNTTLEYFPYIFKDIHLESQGFQDILPQKLQETLIVLNYVAPFPLLLIFNLMLYKSIYDWNKKRARYSSSHHEINAAKMFSVVVFILLSCHTISCVIFYTSRFKEVIFRELMLVQLFCVAFGGTANFMVYYLFAQGFKDEFWKLMNKMKKVFC